MGFTRLLLSRKGLSPCVFYTRSARIDLAETFHIHWRNLRLELDASGFRLLVRGLLVSYLKWTFRGRPRSRPPDRFMELIKARLPSLKGELRIELQQQTDYVHFHYRDLRIELTYAEFLQMAGAFRMARLRFEKSGVSTDAPRRQGLDHETNPKRRVSAAPNSAGLWVGDDRPPDLKTYESMILDPGRGWVKQAK
jgi:hypothetical protein